MKNIRLALVAAVLLLFAGFAATAAEIQHLDPPCWWVGMKNTQLQIMVHGPDISKSTVEIKYPGVRIKEVVKTENPNYLFIYIDIAPKTKPGKMDLVFKEGKEKTVYEYELLPRSTKQGADGFTSADVLYLITPDRFANGNPSNDTIGGARMSRERSGARHGGDIKGVTDHLDYIKDLGVTAIWLNPVQENNANTYHGYAITDFYDVDPRFGTMEEYIEMIDKAHEKGLKVVMDMIFNHCGSSHWWMEDLPTGDWLNFNNTFVPTSHQKWTQVDPHAAPSERKLFTDGWFNNGMPDLNQKNPLVSDYLIQTSTWWIEYARIDGIRQDTHPYMDAEFAAKWCKATMEEYPQFNITGETWYPVGSGFPAWWQKNSTFSPINSNLTSVMDFNLAFIVPDAFVDTNIPDDGKAQGLFNIYVSMANDFLFPDPNSVLIFLDNHDLGRFSTVEDKDLNKYKQGVAFILTTRGIPQIYYGTELLFTGTKQQGDGVIRKDMPGGWEGDERSVFTAEGRTEQENEAWDYMSRILNWRKNSKAVKSGSMIQYAPLHDHGDCYVYARIKDDETVLVVLNGSDKDVTIDMSRYDDVMKNFTAGVDVITEKAYDLTGTLDVPARGVYIFDLKELAPKAPSSANVPAPEYAQFSEGLIDNITAQGWLKEILTRQQEGLTGHPEAMAYPYNSCLWAGELERDSESRGADWWRFEQTAYYLDGLTRLGYLLDDEKFLKICQENIEYVLANPLPAKKGIDIETQKKMEAERRSQRPNRNFDAQVSADPRLRQRMAAQQARREKQMRINAIDRPEGRLGPETSSMAWPFAVFFRAVQAYYEVTGDPRIPEALEKNYLSYPVEELGMDRFVVNVEGILWTYSITKNPALLELAVKAWDEDASNLTQETCLDDSEFHMHGVTMNELMKIPMILYAHTGKEEYLQAALKADYKMETPNMLIDGINSSTEALAGNDPLASHETCDISDYTWTMGYYLMTTGDAQWADRIEKGIFNGGLGAITKDFRSMQYFSCPNQFIATGNSNHNGFKYGLTWMAYRPIHETECCIGNLHRYMPNYVARMWLKDKKGHPVAALYGPSSVVYDLGEGVTVKIDEITQYPFEEQVKFKFTFFKDGKRSADSHHMDFTYRIPGWCKAAEYGFHTETKEWKSGDVFTVRLPMQIEVVDAPVQGKCIQRGPIVYSYAIPANWVEDTKIYDNLAGKVSANPDFKSWELTPAGKWNYALVENMLRGLRVQRTGNSGFPFDPESVPLKIRVPVKGVKDWTLKEDRFTPALPETVVPEGEQVEFIELVPYGSTTLRLTTFPTIKE